MRGFWVHLVAVIAALLLGSQAGAQIFSVTPGGGGGGNFNAGLPYTWTGQNYEPPCPLTDGASITPSASSCAAGATYGVDIQSITLTGANHTINLPSGLKDGQWITFRINHGAGPYNPTLGTGFSTPGSSAPSWCASANCIDDLSCYGFGGTSPNFVSAAIECPGFSANLAAVAGPSIQIVTTGETTINGGWCASTTASANCSAGPITLTSGHRAIIGAYYLDSATGNDGGTTAVVSTISDTGGDLGSCSAAAQSSANLPYKTAIWSCPISGSGSTTVNLTFSAAVFYSYMDVIDVSGLSASPDEGVGNTASGTGGGGTVALSGGGSVENNDLIVITTRSASNASESAAGFAEVQGFSPGFLTSTTNVAGTNSTNVSMPNNPTGFGYMLAIAAFHHS